MVLFISGWLRQQPMRLNGSKIFLPTRTLPAEPEMDPVIVDSLHWRPTDRRTANQSNYQPGDTVVVEELDPVAFGKAKGDSQHGIH